MAQVWTNWAGQQRCAPARIERPASEDQLAQAVGTAARDGLTIRAVGSGHSFTDTCCTDGVMVDLSAMNRMLDAEPETGVVRVQAGVRLRDLARELDRHGLALENQGDIDAQTLAGALATATHGTGERYRNLAANVIACRLVTADGQARAIDHGDELLAARVSVGALGVISEYTLRCVPAFRIHRIDEPRPLDETLERLDEHVGANDHFELFAWPHTGRCLTLTSRRTDAPPRPRSKRTAWVEDELVSNVAFGAAMRLGRARPRLTPRIARSVAGKLSRSEHLEASHLVYAHERRVRFTEMEYAIPRARAREALGRVMDLIARHAIPVAFPIELRFAAPDDAFLSTAHGRDTAYVAVHQFVGMEYESYFRAVEAIMDDYDGRPHWGKRHYQPAAVLRERYPQWDRFQAVRAALDPAGTFTNDYVTRSLGPVVTIS